MQCSRTDAEARTPFVYTIPSASQEQVGGKVMATKLIAFVTDSCCYEMLAVDA